MRWVKHMTMAHADPEVDAVLEQFGVVAYGVYWLIVEEIAAAMEPGKDAPEAIRSVQKWASIRRVQPRVFRKIIAPLAVHLVTVCETSDGRLKIAVPNILKYRDEYSRKSGPTPEQTKTENRTDVKAESAGEQLQTEQPIPIKIPVQTSRSAPFSESIAVNAPAVLPASGRSGQVNSIPLEVTRVLHQSELADDVDLMRQHLNAINRERLNGKLGPADGGTAKNVLNAVRAKRPGIQPEAVAQLLVERLFPDGHRLRPSGWGLIVTLARDL